MEQKEFNNLYTDIEQKLRERFWIIPRNRAMLVIGACTVVLALTVGTTWLAAKVAVSANAAQANIAEILKSHGPATIEKIARLAQAVTVHEGGVISIRFPNNKGRFQIEAGGRLMWYRVARSWRAAARNSPGILAITTRHDGSVTSLLAI